MLVTVSLPIKTDSLYTYETGDYTDVCAGQRVIVPLGRRYSSGWIVKTGSDYTGPVKKIIGIVRDVNFFSDSYLNFAASAAAENLISSGVIFESALDPDRKSIKNLCFETDGEVHKLSEKSFAELTGFSGNNILEFFYKKSTLSSDQDPPEVKKYKTGGFSHIQYTGYRRYSEFKKISEVLVRNDMTVICIVPDNISAAFIAEKLNGDVYNSSVSLKKRREIWAKYVIRGEKGIIVGGQSALFLPVRNPGAILADRAGSYAYENRFYSDFHIFKTAMKRAETEGVPLYSGSSDLTLRTWYRKGDISVNDFRSCEREVDVHMLRPSEKKIPSELVLLLRDCVTDKKKILVILNKKSSKTYLFCRSCSKIYKCQKCKGSAFTDKGKVICRECGNIENIPAFCPDCNSEMSFADDMSRKSLANVIRKETGAEVKEIETLKVTDINDETVLQGEVVMGGTNMINPCINGIFDTVFFLSPESSFSLNRFNSSEMIFSACSELKEYVKEGGVIHVFSVFHFLYCFKLINSENDFFDREMKYREWFSLPPVKNIYIAEVKGTGIRELGKKLRKVYSDYRELLNISKISIGSGKAYRGKYTGIIEIRDIASKIEESGIKKARGVNLRLSESI